MRTRPGLVTAATSMIVTMAVAAGCSGAPRPVLVEPAASGLESASAATTTEPASTESEPSSTTTSTTGADPSEADDKTLTGAELIAEMSEPVGDFRAIVTATGVVVPVLGQTSDGYVVRSPCGVESLVSWGQPVGDVTIVLDAGHGGDEPGARGEQITEAELNLAIARRTAADLNDRGVNTILSRTGDYRMPVISRTFLADHVGAEALVSIHHNTPAVNPSTTPGTEMFVQNESDDSIRLGGILHEEVVDALSNFDVEWVSRRDAGVLTVLNDEGDDAYGINRRPDTPSVLAELAYLGNPKEEALLVTTDYVDAVSAALAAGIERYLLTSDQGSALIEQNRVFNPSGETGGVDGCADPILE